MKLTSDTPPRTQRANSDGGTGMSIQTAVRVLCDLCGQPSESFDGADSNRSSMLYELSQAGWTQTIDGKNPRSRGRINHLNANDLCPTCSSALKAAA